MSLERTKKRTQIGSAILMIIVAGYLIHYTYRAFYRAWRFCFGEPDRWTNLWFVEPDAVIEISTRAWYFGLWSAAIFASVIATLAAVYLLNRVRIGLMFDDISARSIQWVGGLFILAMLVDTIFGFFDRYLLTLHNQEHRVPVQFLYDPSDIKLTILAIVIFLFGWVMRAAVKIEQENKGYI